MPEAVITNAVCPPISAHGGSLAAVRSDDLAPLCVGGGRGIATVIEWIG